MNSFSFFSVTQEPWLSEMGKFQSYLIQVKGCISCNKKGKLFYHRVQENLAWSQMAPTLGLVCAHKLDRQQQRWMNRLGHLSLQSRLTHDWSGCCRWNLSQRRRHSWFAMLVSATSHLHPFSIRAAEVKHLWPHMIMGDMTVTHTQWTGEWLKVHFDTSTLWNCSQYLKPSYLDLFVCSDLHSLWFSRLLHFCSLFQSHLSELSGLTRIFKASGSGLLRGWSFVKPTATQVPALLHYPLSTLWAPIKYIKDKRSIRLDPCPTTRSFHIEKVLFSISPKTELGST